MGSALGAKKNAAAQRGLTLEEYEAKLVSGEKWCSFGKHWDLAVNFTREASRADGFATYCKTCSIQRSRDKRSRMDPEVRKEKGRLAVKAWRDENPEKQAALIARYHERHPGRQAELLRARYAADPESFRAAMQAYREKYPQRVVLARLRSRSKRKDRDFDLTEEDIVIPSHCPVLGIPLTAAGVGQSDNSPSVDRIDSAKGYVRGNICVISMRANRIKNDATIQDLEKVLQYMRSHAHG